jgi:hypothetical protein
LLVIIIIRKTYIYGGDKIRIFIVKPGAVLRGLLNTRLLLVKKTVLFAARSQSNTV